eukprot:2721479-Prymnesium_polylepis.1
MLPGCGDGALPEPPSWLADGDGVDCDTVERSRKEPDECAAGCASGAHGASPREVLQGVL